jgi:hypothetical protein
MDHQDAVADDATLLISGQVAQLFARKPISTTVLGKNRFSTGRSAPLSEIDVGVSSKGDPSNQPTSSQRACHLCQQSPKP